jgi:hypothetical protein
MPDGERSEHSSIWPFGESVARGSYLFAFSRKNRLASIRVPAALDILQ